MKTINQKTYDYKDSAERISRQQELGQSFFAESASALFGWKNAINWFPGIPFKNSENTSLYQVNCIHSQSARSVRPPDNEPPAMDTIEGRDTTQPKRYTPIALYHLFLCACSIAGDKGGKVDKRKRWKV